MKVKFYSYIALLCVCFVLFSCGRRSNPKPPEDRAPGAVLFATAVAESDAIHISWKQPAETASGDSLNKLVSYYILRRNNEVSDQSLFSQKGRFDEVAVVAHRALNASEENRFSYRDKDVSLGKKYEYLIIPKDEDGYQGIPNVIFQVTFIGVSSVVEQLPFSEDDY